MLLKTVIVTSEIMAAILSFIANFTLLYLIRKKTTEELRPYSKILRQNCFVDMFFGFTIGVTFLELEIDHGECIFLTTGAFRNLPHPWNGLLILLNIFALYFCIFSTLIPFFYRYMLIVKSIQLSDIKFYLLYALTGSLSVGISIWLYFTTWPSIDPEKRKEFLYALDSFWMDDDGNYPIFLASHLNNLIIYLTILYAFILVATTFSLITWFCYKTLDHLNKFQAQMSEKNRKLQKQLTYTLIAQALVPFTIAFLPVTLILITVTFGLSVSRLGVITITMVSWVAVLNPLCVIFLVGPYREAILRRVILRKVAPTTQPARY